MTSIDDAEKFFNSGKRFFFEHRDYERAAQAFEASLRLEPLQPHGQLLLGVCRLESGDVAGALPPLAHCVRLEPEHRDGRNALGMALRRLSWADDALIQFARAAYLGNPQAPDMLAEAGMD